MAKEGKTVENAESKEVQDVVAKKAQKSTQGTMYSSGELAANARKIFGTRQECVTAALKSAGRSEYTVSEAKEIVEKFLKREVK